MPVDLTSFGRAVASARKEKQLSQKELAGLIRKEDGQTITPQYLNDIEHDRRSPSSDTRTRCCRWTRVDGAQVNLPRVAH